MPTRTLEVGVLESLCLKLTSLWNKLRSDFALLFGKSFCQNPCNAVVGCRALAWMHYNVVHCMCYGEEVSLKTDEVDWARIRA